MRLHFGAIVPMRLKWTSLLTFAVALSLLWIPLLLLRFHQDPSFFVSGELLGAVCVVLLLFLNGHLDRIKHEVAFTTLLIVWLLLALVPLIGLCAETIPTDESKLKSIRGHIPEAQQSIVP